MVKKLCITVGLIGLAICYISCNSSRVLVQSPPDPNRIWLRINDNEPATKDTVLWVTVTGQHLEWMKISDVEDFDNQEWVPFDTLTIVRAPHVEGEYTIFGKFISDSNEETEVFSDDIVLDFSASINTLNVVAEADTLYPGNWVEFSMETGEIGFASIRFGNLFQSLSLRPDSEGYYNDILIIPSIVIHEDASIIGTFTDIAGNQATPIEYGESYPIRGPELNPAVVGLLSLGEANCDDIWYYRGICYISTVRKVHVVNVYDKSDPVYLEYIPTTHYSEGLVGDSDLLLIADNDAGMMICSIGDPEHPVRLAYARAWGLIKDVAIHNNISYVASALKGLFIYNLQSPAIPDFIDRIPLNCTGESICKNDSVVYVAGNNGMAIINIIEPFYPTVVSQLNSINENVREMVYHKGNLLLATWNAGVIRINVEDPYNPFYVQAYPHLNECTDLFIDGSFLLVTRGEKLSIVNLSNLNELPILDEISDFSYAKALFANNGLVYVVDNNSIAIIELTQPG